MMIYSRKVNSQLQRRFEADQACSERVRGAEWRRRPVLHKALESIVRLLSPVL